jgi:hypothetical protein
VSKAGRVVNKFLRRLGFELKRYINYSNFYYVSDDEKALAIDFLAYVMRAKPMLCLNVFDERDRVEVLKFVRNKVYCALLSSIDPALLFDSKDLELQREYKVLRSRVRKKGDYYVLEAYGREYRLPVNRFEMPVFYQALEDMYFLYLVTKKYSPQHEKRIKWDDPEIGIEWPRRENIIISDKDRKCPPFREAETNFEY